MYDGPTKPVRIAADLAEKLGHVIRFGDSPAETIAALLDPAIRPLVEARYRQLPETLREHLESSDGVRTPAPAP